MIAKYEEIDLSELKDIIHNNIRLSRIIRNDGVYTDYIICSNGKIIKLYDNAIREIPTHNLGHGYRACSLKVNAGLRSSNILVHRLVAEAFIPNPDNKPQVNHIDGDKTNNDVSNLEWNTAKENMNHAVRTGLLKYAEGEQSGQATITADTATRICELLEENKLTLAEIAKKCNTTKSIVSYIKTGVTWTSISKNYNVKNHNIREDGARRMTKELAHRVCQELEANNYKMSEIAQMLGVTYYQVDEIRQHNTLVNISKNYNIDNHTMRKNAIKENVPKIPKICELLQDTDMSPKGISKVLDVPEALVYRVLSKSSWKLVSDKYDFSHRIK